MIDSINITMPAAPDMRAVIEPPARRRIVQRRTVKPCRSTPKPDAASFTVTLDLARRLDLEASCETQAGHHLAAERLSLRAAELRGWL